MSLNLVLSYEPSALAAPQSFRDAMQTAANILDSTIQDNITVTIQVGYGDYFNNEITVPGTSAVGGDLYGSFVSYTSLRAALASHETSTLDQTFVNSLPTTTSVNGMSGFYVPSAIEKALGMISPTASSIDGAVGLGTGIPTADLVGVALHEFTHAFGREPGAGTFDLARYTSPGNHLFSSGSTAPAAYFSIDGGVTKLADYGQNSDPSDFLNSGVQGSTDPFNEYYSGSTSQTLSTVDKELLDAMGFNTSGTAPGAPSATTSRLVASSSTVTADGTSATTLTVTVKDASGNAVANTAVTLSGSGSSNSFGAISGTTDANGVFTTTLASTKAQTETITATESGVQETTSVSFVAGAASAATSSIVASSPTVAADGTSTTTLTVTVEDAQGNAVAGTAVTLSGSGSSNSFGAISGTTNANGVFTTTLASTLVQNETITATEGSVQEQTSVSFVAGGPSATTSSIISSSPTVTADGTSTTTLTVTVHDAQGHAVAGTAVTLSGSGSANSFGAISGTTNANGVFTTTLASTLAQNETITATEGVAQETTSVSFVAGAASATTSSIVSSSPTVAADGTSTTTLTVTVHDAHGNAVAGTAVTLSGSGSSNSFGAISGTTNASGVFTTTLASTMVQNETITATEGNVQEHTSVSFVAPMSGTVIEAFGSTSLVEVSNNFYLDINSNSTSTITGVGPELKYAGAAVSAGQFGGWTPIGVEQTATGYEVAWKVTGADQYSVWSTDSNGNYISNTVSNVNGAVSGSSTALQTIETTFHQDLNGDGVIGVPTGSSPTTTVIESFGSTSLTEVDHNYYLNSISSGSGPELKYAGAAVSAGQFGGWTPIGVEQTPTGYEVAWKVTGADQYSVWSTDSNGNYISNISNVNGAVSGSSSALEAIETEFHQDLNGDGAIGVPVPAATSPVATNTASTHLADNGTVSAIVSAGHEAFVFAPNFGQLNIANFALETDTIQFSKATFPDVTAALAATHNDGHGNAVITDAANDTLTIEHVTAAQLYAHQHDFHII
jgi:protocatechuate 3,4-dioxygenase beta subunit